MTEYVGVAERGGTGILGSGPFRPAPPTNPPSEEDAEALLVNEMTNLSVQEREVVFHDLHGVPNEVTEDPAFVRDCLDQLEYELVQHSRGTAYEMVAKTDYVKSVKFRLMFLRADSFMARRAAVRMISFMEEKLSLFGKEKLTKTITLGDLDDMDIAVLESGCMSCLQAQDRSGRLILCGVPFLTTETIPTEHMMRAQYYLLMSAVESEMVQKRGCVGIIQAYNLTHDHLDIRKEWAMTRLRAACPVRLVCSHFCYGDPFLRSILPIVIWAMGSHSRQRFRYHFGTPVETTYKLMSFGIDPDDLPLEPSGEPRPEVYLRWIRMRRAMELSSPTTSAPVDTQQQERLSVDTKMRGDDHEVVQPGEDVVSSSASMVDTPATSSALLVQPSDKDVVFGRGCGIQNRPGNVRLRHILDMHMEEYESMGKYGKTAVAERVIRLVHKSNGRFLKPSSNGAGWEEVDELTARNKVARAFRARRAARQQLQQQEPGTAVNSKAATTATEASWLQANSKGRWNQWTSPLSTKR